MAVTYVSRQTEFDAALSSGAVIVVGPGDEVTVNNTPPGVQIYGQAGSTLVVAASREGQRVVTRGSVQNYGGVVLCAGPGLAEAWGGLTFVGAGGLARVHAGRCWIGCQGVLVGQPGVQAEVWLLPGSAHADDDAHLHVTSAEFCGQWADGEPDYISAELVDVPHQVREQLAYASSPTLWPI